MFCVLKTYIFKNKLSCLLLENVLWFSLARFSVTYVMKISAFQVTFTQLASSSASSMLKGVRVGFISQPIRLVTLTCWLHYWRAFWCQQKRKIKFRFNLNCRGDYGISHKLACVSIPHIISGEYNLSNKICRIKILGAVLLFFEPFSGFILTWHLFSSCK